MVLVRHTDRSTYGAVVEGIEGPRALLTFTPPGKPRAIPLGLIVSASTSDSLVDPDQVPRYQPIPDKVPRRRPIPKDDLGDPEEANLLDWPSL